MTQNKTLPQAIAELEEELLHNYGREKGWVRSDIALPVIREQDRRIELLHGYLRFGYTLHNVKSLHELIDKALAATSQDAEWKV